MLNTTAEANVKQPHYILPDSIITMASFTTMSTLWEAQPLQTAAEFQKIKLQGGQKKCIQ